MTLAFYLRQLRRESRGSRGRLLFFVLCLAVGVAGVVAVASLGASIENGIRREGRLLLGADIVIAGNQPIPDALRRAAAKIPGVRTMDVREMSTMAAAPPDPRGVPGRSAIVELLAVGPGYPFYGRLELAPSTTLDSALAPDAIAAAPALLESLRLDRGSAVLIGGKRYRIAATVLAEPNALAPSFLFAPRVFVSRAGLDRAGLVGFGSRIEDRLLIRLPEDASRADNETAVALLRKALADSAAFEFQSATDPLPQLRAGIRRATRFLGLVALLSLVIGGIGIAQTIQAWVAGRLDAIAVLKSLGLRPREIVALYLGQTLLLGIAGSLVGALAGSLVPLLIPGIVGPLLPGQLVDPWAPGAVLRGLALGVAVALLFSAPPLWTLRRVPAARVFRHEAEPVAAARPVRALQLGLLFGGLAALASAQSGSIREGLAFATGFGAAAAVLGGAAWLAIRLVGRLPRRRVPFWVRHGLAAVARPGAGTIGAAIALGLGVLVVLGMYLVQERIAGQFAAELPHDAPTDFLVDVQPDQWPGVRDLVVAAGASGIESLPMAVARLASIDGKPPASTLSGDESGARDGRRERGEAYREQRLTWLEKLPPGNTVVEGTFWNGHGRDEISVEQGFAKGLGIKLGSRLAFDIGGVPVETRVTSLRKVNWRTFGLNFFFIVQPGTLDAAPHVVVASFRLPASREQALQDTLAARYPNVLKIRLRELLDKITRVADRIAFAVQLLGGFTVLAGITILAGAVSATSIRRGREAALLKTLGLTRLGVAGVFSVEYALIGLLAGVIGALAAGALAWTFLSRVELTLDPHAAPFVVTVIAAAALACGAGLAASARSLARRPMDVLRAE